MTKSYEPMFAPGRPVPRRSAAEQGAAMGANVWRDNLSLWGWMAAGALAQMALFALPVKRYLAALPFLAYALLHTADALLVTLGLRRNAVMDHVIRAKYGGFVPDAEGRFSHLNRGKGGDGQMEKNDSNDNNDNEGEEDPDANMVVFVLGFRSNHPLGMLAPGVADMTAHFMAMQRDLADNFGTSGMLGCSSYKAIDARSTGNEISTRYYFRSMAHLHAWAHGPVHRRGWDWLEKSLKAYPHLGVMHEAFTAPRAGFETIYLNWEPSGFAATRHPRQHRDADGNTTQVWASPIVEVGHGKLAGSKGRLGSA